METSKVIKLGQHISISDPAYFNEEKGWLKVNVKVKAGYYVSWTEQEDFDFFGKRTGKLMMFHNKFMKRMDEGTTDFHYEHIGDFGVDSGLASIYNSNTNPMSEDGKHDEDAVICRSGAGDGFYPVYAAIEKKQVVGIMIDFNFTDEEEEIENNLAESN